MDEEARGCGVLLQPMALLVLNRLSGLAQLCDEAEQATLASLVELLAWIVVSPPCLLAHLGPEDAPWSSLGLLPHSEDPLGEGSPDAGGADEACDSDFESESKDEAEREGANPFDEAEHASWEGADPFAPDSINPFDEADTSHKPSDDHEGDIGDAGGAGSAMDPAAEAVAAETAHAAAVAASCTAPGLPAPMPTRVALLLRVGLPPACRLRLEVVPFGPGFRVGAEIVAVPSVDPSGAQGSRGGACVHASLALRPRAARQGTSGIAVATGDAATRLPGGIAVGVMRSAKCSAGDSSVGVGGSTPAAAAAASVADGADAPESQVAAEYDGADEGDDGDVGLDRHHSANSVGSDTNSTGRRRPARRRVSDRLKVAHFNVVREMLTLAAEQLFDKAAAHAAQPGARELKRRGDEYVSSVTGCAYLSALALALAPLAALVKERLAPTVQSVVPTLHPSAVETMLSVLGGLMAADVEVHGRGALADQDTREMLPQLAQVEAALSHPKLPAVALLDSSAVGAMFDSWLEQQHAAFYQVLEASLEHEKWTPVFATKLVSSSLVDLFQCFSQTVDFFLGTVEPCTGALRCLDLLLHEIIGAVLAYVGRIKALCGDASELAPPRAADAQPASAAPRRQSVSAPSLPAAVVARFEALPPTMLSTMVNNVHSCGPMLVALWEEVERGWARVSSQGLRPDALDQALKSLDRSAGELLQFAATRLIFWDLRVPLLGELYLRSVSDPPEQMAALLPLLSEKVSAMVGLVKPELTAGVALAVLRAALAAFEHVLLDGGTRAFLGRDNSNNPHDAMTIDEDLQSLLDLFTLNINNCCGCQLDEDAVEGAAARLREIVEIFKRPVREVVALYQTAEGNPFAAEVDTLAAVEGPSGGGPGGDASAREPTPERNCADLLRVLQHRGEAEARDFVSKQVAKQRARQEPASHEGESRGSSAASGVQQALGGMLKPDALRKAASGGKNLLSSLKGIKGPVAGGGGSAKREPDEKEEAARWSLQSKFGIGKKGAK